MKTITVRDLQKNVRESVDTAQRDRVVITRRGKPAALLVGVEGELIRARRKQPTLSLEELKKQLGVKTKS